MKTALAIICSLLLIWTQTVPVTAASGAAKRAPACCDCASASCCAAKPAAPVSPPVPVAPAPAGSQHQSATLTPAAVSWTLPDGPVSGLSAFPPSLTRSVDAPLYARNCVRLI